MIEVTFAVLVLAGLLFFARMLAGPSLSDRVLALDGLLVCGIAELSFALTLLVMIGRVYVGAHNPLDVVAGLGAGLVLGGVVTAFLG